MNKILIFATIALSIAGYISASHESESVTRSEMHYRFEPENPFAISDGVWKGYVVVHNE